MGLWKQSSSRNQRGRRLRPGHWLQVFLLVAVGIWLVYQLGHCYKRRAVAVKISGSRGVGGELVHRRWLDRKSLVKFAVVASGEVASGVRDGGIIARGVEREPRSNEGTGDGEEEDDGGLFGYDEGDASDFHPEIGEGEESNELDRRSVRQVSATSGVQEDSAHQLVNGAADAIDMAPEHNRSLNTYNLRKISSSGV